MIGENLGIRNIFIFMLILWKFVYIWFNMGLGFRVSFWDKIGESKVGLFCV